MKKILVAVFLVSLFALYAYFAPTSQNGPVGFSSNTNKVISSNGKVVSSLSSNVSSTASQFKDGTYVGQSVDAYYGIVQVQAVITNGKITDVQFLSYPNTHSTSVMINSYANPILTQEAITSQSSNVNLISGATLTSEAFTQSLASALLAAKG